MKSADELRKRGSNKHLIQHFYFNKKGRSPMSYKALSEITRHMHDDLSPTREQIESGIKFARLLPLEEQPLRCHPRTPDMAFRERLVAAIAQEVVDGNGF